jgi:hypothetical protein
MAAIFAFFAHTCGFRTATTRIAAEVGLPRMPSADERRAEVVALVEQAAVSRPVEARKRASAA